MTTPWDLPAVNIHPMPEERCPLPCLLPPPQRKGPGGPLPPSQDSRIIPLQVLLLLLLLNALALCVMAMTGTHTHTLLAIITSN